MNLIKIFLVILLPLAIFFSYQTRAQTPTPKQYKLLINLDNAPFDSLYMHDYAEGRNILIAGKKTKKFTWEITIPDSLIWDSESIELLASPNNAKDKISRLIRFITEKAGKKIIVVNIGVDDESTYIYGTYREKTVFPNQNIRVKTSNKDSVVAGNLICEDFNLIIKDANSDIAVRAQDPFFSWFMDSNDGKISYDSYLASYIELSKKYPDSRFLISNLSTNLTIYKSKTDVNKVYENFSDKYKNTIWAKNIERFLYDGKFQNTSLPTSNKNKYESIIQDSSKYNLIIFSASWCGNCMEEIPLLKKIYQDLGKNLILTYVSIDNAQGVAAFQKVIRDKNIPWRALFAYPDIKKIKQRYFIEGISHSILVYPNQHMEIIEVRKNEDRSKLYAIVKALGIR